MADGQNENPPGVPRERPDGDQGVGAQIVDRLEQLFREGMTTREIPTFTGNIHENVLEWWAVVEEETERLPLAETKIRIKRALRGPAKAWFSLNIEKDGDLTLVQIRDKFITRYRERWNEGDHYRHQLSQMKYQRTDGTFQAFLDEFLYIYNKAYPEEGEEVNILERFWERLGPQVQGEVHGLVNPTELVTVEELRTVTLRIDNITKCRDRAGRQAPRAAMVATETTGTGVDTQIQTALVQALQAITEGDRK